MPKTEADTLFQSAQTHAAQGDLNLCVQTLYECLKQNRFHVYALSHLAWLLSQQGGYRQALGLYFRLLLLRPWSVEIHLRTWQCMQFACFRWVDKQSGSNRLFRILLLSSESVCFYASLILCYFIEVIHGKNHLVSKWMRHNQRMKTLANINEYEYYKVSEMDFVVSRLCKQEGQTVLDLGSGRSAIPSFTAFQSNNVIAAELDDTALQTQKQICKNLPLTNLVPLKANFLRLPFSDNSVNAVSIISTIEHVPNHGDTQTMMELYRVLKPGGTLLVTVPVSHIANEQHTAHTIGHVYQECSDEAPGYLRLYNPEWIQKRLIAPSGLRLNELKYIGETSRWGWLGLGRNFVDHNQIIHPSAFAAPLTLLFTRELQEDELGKAHWAVACLQLQKPIDG